jgi:diguanylate cyclase (GGDEF)-like protein
VKPWWNWRVAVFGRGNRDYREAFLREDINQARTVIAIVALWLLACICADYLRPNFSDLIFQLLALRVALISVSVGLVLNLPQTKNLDIVDYSVLTWGIACALLFLLGDVNDNTLSIENVNDNLGWVLGFYLVLPNRQPFKTIPALIISSVILYVLVIDKSFGVHSFTNPNFLINVFTVIAINSIGIFTSIRLDAHRYRQYLFRKTLVTGREQLRELAITDSLTGILNRRGFFELADVELDRFKRYGDTFSFVIFDLDKLKRINDTHGHPGGDLAINHLIDVINLEKRSSDILGRLAGDEFGILLPNTYAARALEVLLRMQKMVLDKPAELPNGKQLYVHFSAGITNVTIDDQSFDDIYRRADKALLSAKRKGRDRIEKI